MPPAGGDPMMGGMPPGMPPMPPGGDPMAGGAMPPVPPELMAIAQGGGGGRAMPMPGMDPAMAGGAPPMPGGDPMMGMDPAAMGGEMPPEAGGDEELIGRVDAMEDMLSQIAEALGIQVNEPPMDAPPGTEPADMAAASDMGMDPALGEGFNDEAMGMGGAPPELPPMEGPETMKTASGETVTIASMLQRMNQYK